MVYFTSDLHLGHKSIPKYRNKFKTLKEHDEYIFNLLESLTKRDVLFILGDFLFDGEHYDEYAKRLKTLDCRLKLVMGNHDSMKLYSEDFIEMQLPLFSYKKFWLSHCPIHPGEMRNRTGNLHGHLHLEEVKKETFCPVNYELPFHDGFIESKDEQYFNVNLDVNNYNFVTLDTIKNYFTS